MAVKAFEKPKGSGIWWIWLTHQGFTTSQRLGTDKLLAFEMAAGGNAAIADGVDVVGIYDAFVQAIWDYRNLPMRERRRRMFRLIPGGRSD